MDAEKGYDIERHGHGGGEQPEAVPPDPGSIRALDVCPNCGSPMPGIDTLVCLRCGFNTKTLKVEKTATGAAAAPRNKRKAGGAAEAEEAREAEPVEPVEPISRPGRGALILPGAAAGVGALLLIAGYLSGAGGLFVGPPEDTTFPQRLAAMGSGMVLVLLWAGAGLGGLVFLARVVHLAPLGDIRLAGVRLLGIAFLTRLPALVINVGLAGLEWSIEFAVGSAIAIFASMYLFSLDVRDALLAWLGTIAIFIVLVVVSAAVWWAIA